MMSDMTKPDIENAVFAKLAAWTLKISYLFNILNDHNSRCHLLCSFEDLKKGGGFDVSERLHVYIP